LAACSVLAAWKLEVIIPLRTPQIHQVVAVKAGDVRRLEQHLFNN
jgi:ribosomal protein L19